MEQKSLTTDERIVKTPVDNGDATLYYQYTKETHVIKGCSEQNMPQMINTIQKTTLPYDNKFQFEGVEPLAFSAASMGTTMPGTSWPGTTEPGTTYSGTTWPSTTQPNPGTTQPCPGSTQPCPSTVPPGNTCPSPGNCPPNNNFCGLWHCPVCGDANVDCGGVGCPGGTFDHNRYCWQLGGGPAAGTTCPGESCPGDNYPGTTQPGPAITVTFNSGGATGTLPSAITVGQGQAITVPGPGSLRNGEAFFNGWRVNGFTTRVFPGDRPVFSFNVQLVAQWIRLEGGEYFQPGTTQPGTTNPGNTWPGTTWPGTTHPGTTCPGTTCPGTTQPGF